MTLGQLLVATVTSAGIGYLVFEAVPSLSERFLRFYRVEEKACREILVQAHVDLPKYLAPPFYLAGPLVVTTASLLILPNYVVGLFVSAILSLIFRKGGRGVARFLYDRRLKQIKKQMMDAMGLMANALRSGLSFLQSMEMAANEMPGPLSREFQQIVQETRLGATVEQALTGFKRRIPLKEVTTLVDSILVLRETGGNLVETFEILIHTLREEERVQGKIRALTTQGIAQAVVIILLPFGLGAALYIVSPDYIAPLLDHPIGWFILFVMMLFQTAGAYAMKKIVTIRV